MKRAIVRCVKALAPAGSRRRTLLERCLRTLARPRYRALGTRPLDLRDPQAVAAFLRTLGRPPLRPTAIPTPEEIARVGVICDYHRDLWNLVPLAFTPAGSRGILCWLIERRDWFGLRDESITAFLHKFVEDPARGLADCYLRQPDWQHRFPDALTPDGWERLKTWIRRTYRIDDPWLDEATLPARFRSARGDAPRRGVNVLGHFCYPSGLGEAAVAAAAALERAGVAVSRRDVPANWKSDKADREEYLGLEPHDQTLILLAPEPFFVGCHERSGLYRRPGVQRIAVWYWELETAPRRWARLVQGLTEVWAPTRFIADALRPVLPVPVVTMPPGVELPSFAPLPRSHFGLPDDTFLFLFAFDMCSVMERKNPLAAIDAFRRAFRPDEPASLVLKVSRSEADPTGRARLLDAAGRAGAYVLDSLLSRDEQLALTACCDCYVSLHRSEGFGLTLAEAMLMGKPVLATGYSGNLDFMNDRNSLLVRHTRRPIPRGLPIYESGGSWAEPDVNHAAELMRQVYERPDEARALGQRARADLRASLSLEAAGERMARRLEELRPSERGIVHG